MYENLKPLYPAGPCNRTDPIVRHSSPYKGGVIAKLYGPQNDQETTSSNPNSNFDSTSVDAVHIPVVKLNNRVLDNDQLEYFKLSSTGLVPSLIISVKDDNGMIEFSDVPGFDNVITIAMIIPVDGVYKKISLDFYIVSCKFFGSSVTYMATFKCMPLEKTHLEQIVFHPPIGCPAQWCMLPPSETPTTYKLLHCIAHDCGLGFAATQQTKEIKDYNYRLVHSQKYIDVIREHTAFGGLDKNSIFDSWIDIWGNIVLVNVPWVFNENVTPDELATVASYGTRQTNTTEGKDSYHVNGLVHRMITNFNEFGQMNNLMIKSYTQLTDTATLFSKGSNNTYNMMLHRGNKGHNNIDTFDIVQKENSFDGQAGDYEFAKTDFIGFEWSEITPICKQKYIHDKFFEKFRARMLKVELRQPNFMLERGMLTSVSIFETDPAKKRKMLGNWSTFDGNENTDEEDPSVQPEIKAGEVDYATPLLNITVSGIYYIDGVEFEYNKDDEDIVQTLYLVKKGNIYNWDNRTTKPKFKDVGESTTKK